MKSSTKKGCYIVKLDGDDFQWSQASFTGTTFAILYDPKTGRIIKMGYLDKNGYLINEQSNLRSDTSKRRVKRNTKQKHSKS